MTRITVFMILSFLGFNPVMSQRIAAQTESNTIKDDSLGVTFIVPDGWSATKKPVGYVMGSASTQGFMLLNTDDFNSLKSLKAAMETGIEQQDGSMLTPDGDLAMLGKLGVSGMYQGVIDGIDMLGFMMAILPDGKGKAIICISVAPKNVFNQSNMDQLKILMRSAARHEIQQ
jgi:hypothetical protein